jgi:hypothetical protein
LAQVDGVVYLALESLHEIGHVVADWGSGLGHSSLGHQNALAAFYQVCFPHPLRPHMLLPRVSYPTASPVHSWHLRKAE